MLEYCAQARYAWNLAWNLHQFGTMETYGKASRRKRRDGTTYIHQKRRPVRPLPGLGEQSRMLTEARAEHDWLAAGSAVVQQQGLRDFADAMQRFFAGTHGFPKQRKRRLNESFRIVGKRGQHWDIRRLSRNVGAVRIPKVGWVRFRWSRAVPEDAKSFRVALDRSGRWHVRFAGIPAPVPAPGTGEVVGVDRGVVITAALSTGEKLHCPGLSARERAQLRKSQRRMDKTQKGSPQRETERRKLARLHARETDRRKDWCEKASTDLARRFDVIRFEDLNIKGILRKPEPRPDPDKPGDYLPNGHARKAGLNRVIAAQGWGILVRRTEQKAPGRVEKVVAAYTSLRCSDCGWIDKNSRNSQAGFVCTNCGFTCNADLNAALNIAAGHAGGTPPSVREPLASAA